MKFRHEVKHSISFSDYLILRSRLRAVMKHDENSSDGIYEIRSLYFDNIYDKALKEKINGIGIREKFRIRFYNGDTSFIRLEKKSKYGGLCNKQSVPVTEEEVRSLILGKTDFMLDGERPLLAELYSKMRGEGLMPKTIVDYTREAFVFEAGNVRVTLDSNIRTGLFSNELFNSETATVPIPDDPIILEVKWDEFLPGIIRDTVCIDGRRGAAFSKYASCRAYD